MVERRFKLTEIGLIPEDWEVKELGDVVKIFSGNSFKSFDSKDFGIRWLKIANVSLNAIDWKEESFLPYFFLETYKNYVLNEGDIVIALTRPLLGLNLKIAQIKKSDSPSLLNQRVGRLDTAENRKFAYYLFQSNRFLQKLNDSMLGTDPPNMSVNIVYKFQIPLPPLPEQEAIAEALSDADAWIESLEKLIAKKRLIKQGAMQQLLSPKEDWEVKRLGEVAEIIIGLTYSPNDVRDFGTLVLRSSNIQKNKLAFENNVFVDMTLPERVIVKENDLLVCVRNGSKQLIGKCALIDKKTEGQAFGAFMSIIRSQYGKYLYHYFQTNHIQVQIDENLGATINQLTNATLKSFEINIPKSLTEQTRIISTLSDMDAELGTLENKLHKARQLKQGMMQQLLTGKIRLV